MPYKYIKHSMNTNSMKYGKLPSLAIVTESSPYAQLKRCHCPFVRANFWFYPDRNIQIWNCCLNLPTLVAAPFPMY